MTIAAGSGYWLGRAYHAKTTPHRFVSDPKGTLVYVGAIDDKPSTTDVIATAKNYVLAALDEAMAGKAASVASSQSYGCSIKYLDELTATEPDPIFARFALCQIAATVAADGLFGQVAQSGGQKRCNRNAPPAH